MWGVGVGVSIDQTVPFSALGRGSQRCPEDVLYTDNSYKLRQSNPNVPSGFLRHWFSHRMGHGFRSYVNFLEGNIRSSEIYK